MVCPAILAGIEEWNVSTLKITRDVWPLVGVASFAAQSEIFSCGRATMFFRDDVIDLKRQQGNIRRDLAILAPLRGTLPDKALELSIHAALTARAPLA